MKAQQPNTKTVTPEDLIRALVLIDNRELMSSFLDDIMTKKEVAELSARLKAAAMLLDGTTYTNVAIATGLSSRTIARISDWIKNGSNGYRPVIEMLATHHTHMTPVRG